MPQSKIINKVIMATAEAVYEYFESDHVFIIDKATGERLSNATIKNDGQNDVLTKMIDAKLVAAGVVR
jgi:hypothetical protein